MKFLFIFIAVFVVFAGSLLAESQPVTLVTGGEPAKFGSQDLSAALGKYGISGVKVFVSVGAKGAAAKILQKAGVSIPEKPESFVIAWSGSEIVVAGSDEVGAMYGCFELAERLQMDGKGALNVKVPIIQSPYVEFRAVNPFLTLPYGDGNIDDWWFLKEDFWRGYIDMLSRARINWIDLHGMYDIKATTFPNIYPYFIKSEKFPEAGIEPWRADRNLAMLNKVIKMAKARGIKFALMSYSTAWDGPFLRRCPYQSTEENLAEYTRECVRKTIQLCPDLAMIGFRIGESGKGEDFYLKSYVPAIKEAGRPIDLYTRSWGAKKSRILDIGREFPGRWFLEIKYNGEQYGPAHMIAGGRMTEWRDYSYQNYMTYPRSYKVIWQIRQNGTHRVFPWGNPDFITRTARNSKLGGAIGFCTEPINAYYPAYDYLHREDAACRWYKWVYQRDWFFYDVWGRRSYDPDVPERIWLRKFKDRFGSKPGEAIYRAFIVSSQILPYCKMFYSLGPDHRAHAPELQTGDSIKSWAERGPFDTQNIQSPREFADRTLEGNPSARWSSMRAADMLADLSSEVMHYLEKANTAERNSSEFMCLTHDLKMLSNLGNYYANRLRSATCFAFYRKCHDKAFADEARKYHLAAVENWNSLAEIGESHYKPFVDTLKMNTTEYTWRKEAEKLSNHLEPLDQAEQSEQSPMGLTLDVLKPRGDKTGPEVSVQKADLTPAVNGYKILRVSAKVRDPVGVKSVLLKYKPFPSESRWKTMPMEFRDGLWIASIRIPPVGMMWGIEALDKDDNGTLWPDFRVDIPYRLVEPWDEPGFSSQSMEAVVNAVASNADNVEKYSLMVLGRDANAFNNASPELKASVLKAVENGLSLFIDRQDFPKFDLSWLPGEIKTNDDSLEQVTLDSNCPLFQNLPEIWHDQRTAVIDSFASADSGWQFVTEPKAVAIRKHGKGYIILPQLRLADKVWDYTSRSISKRSAYQMITCYLTNTLEFVSGTRKDKPVLMLDSGTGITGLMCADMNWGIVSCE